MTPLFDTFVSSSSFVFFNETATTSVSTYCHPHSLHASLPISVHLGELHHQLVAVLGGGVGVQRDRVQRGGEELDRCVRGVPAPGHAAGGDGRRPVRTPRTNAHTG